MQPSLMIRPASAIQNMPFYAPERDFGIQGVRMLNEVELLLRGENRDKFLDVARSMGVGVGFDDDQLSKSIEDAGFALARFMAACQAKKIENGQWVDDENPPDFEQALQELEESTSRKALFFLLSLIGYMSLNAFFYGERSILELGTQSHHDYNTFCNLVTKHSIARITGEPPKEPLTRLLGECVIGLMQTGVSEQTIHTMVSSAAAKELRNESL
ncbi:MAG: hypothetical protein KatS3mg109_0143 [Pirellulaceae bacterium]|nr:MAG: hypothetical protein KatS3mg109_0143 [Pirellulaceae bacterium]